jgi:hypothetical protein
MNFRNLLPFRKAVSPRVAQGKKTRGPQIAGRVSVTEALLFKLAKKLRARAEAHAVQNPKTEDIRARAALLELAAHAEKAAGEMREPELPLNA